ncbi:MAG TPA: hypothetical protein VGQ99_01120 [Tepidisphaeraceae bacterium]|jgi:hypothetical protein|nr:hypothetical protein [Tepidisphaeraceae bacterium]
MFQTALGRLGSAVIAPSESLDLHVFIDAGGRSNSRRVWGGLALLNARELSWIDAELSQLRALLPEALNQSGELKGKNVPTQIAKDAGLRFRQENRRILFWANWYPEFDGPELIETRRQLSQFLADLRPNATHLERSEIEAWHTDMRDYFDGLLPVNGHKVISIVAHLSWLFGEIARVNLGPQLRSAHVVIDEENLPTPELTNRFLTGFVAAGLQAAGMSFRRTGGCFRRLDSGGCHVTMDASAKSDEHAGLQYADILLQVVQRQLPGFTRKGNGTAT